MLAQVSLQFHGVSDLGWRFWINMQLYASDSSATALFWPDRSDGLKLLLLAIGDQLSTDEAHSYTVLSDFTTMNPTLGLAL